MLSQARPPHLYDEAVVQRQRPRLIRLAGAAQRPRHRGCNSVGNQGSQQPHPEGTGQTQPPEQLQQQVLQGATANSNQPQTDEPLWWVEKFEARRQQQQPEALQGHQTSSSTSSTHIPTSPQPPAKPQTPWLKVTQQLVQLVLVVAALIFWPASLYPGGLTSPRVWLLYFTYVAFFGGGSVWRLVQYGPLASRSKDKQAKSWGTRAAQLMFIAMMPVLHWGAVGTFCKEQLTRLSTAHVPVGSAATDSIIVHARSQLPTAAGGGAAQAAAAGAGHGFVTLYDVIGFVLLAGAVALNWWSARQLGKAYDRVVQPEALITSGPYALVQHPIYSSYMLLFVGFGMFLHSFGYAVLALVVCFVYYKSRVQLEAAVLRAAFGKQYEEYQQRTKLFVPYLL